MKQIFLILLFTSINFAQNLLLMSDDVGTVYAVDLDGASENMTINAPDPLCAIAYGTNNYTFMFWLKQTEAISSTYEQFIATGAQFGWDWATRTIYNGIRSGFNDGTGAVYVQPSTDKTAILNSGWHHICTTITRGGNIVLYIDGANVGTADISSKSGDIVAPVTSINLFAAATARFMGEMQAINGRALTPSEVLEAYNLGLKGNHYKSSYPTGTIILWLKWDGKTDASFKLDAAQGNVLIGAGITTADQVILLGGYK